MCLANSPTPFHKYSGHSRMTHGVLVACGLWVTLKENLIPSLLMPESAVQDLDKVLRSETSFRADLAAVSAKDPPANTSAVGDLAS